MDTIGRILLKLIIIQLIILIIVQGFIHEFGFFENGNKLILYEGASGLEQEKDVIRYTD